MAPKRDVKFNGTKLASGLRVVTEKIPFARSVAIGIWIDVGSRDEIKEENGISHFIEHMLFKGTRTRSPQKIAAALESLGGSLNAFTSREQTCFHALVLDEHLEQAVDVLSDILMNSTISTANIKLEKGVVIEEIREVNETPSDRIHELFSDSFWRGQPLGQPIMGTEKNVRSFDRRRLRAHMRKHYCADRIVVAAAGNVFHRKLVELVKEKFDFPSQGVESRANRIKNPTGFSAELFRNGSRQTHICLGFPGISFADPLKYSLLVLHYYLGGGMSSVLFQKIREEKAMAYTVYTFSDTYSDCGVFGTYLATDRKHFHDAIDTILKEYSKVKKFRLPNSKLDRIKDQLKGNLLLALESVSSRMNRIGRHEIMTGQYLSVKEAIARIDAVTADDVIEIARQVFNAENLTVTALGSAFKKDLSKLDWSLLKS
ncbi:MAG: insulinase family protein [Candidatus Zixiibacteriota bacterium]|nr:MAG: insulinase family protein [candidate division Zixibacteria bacterium]